jgi:ATP-dependent Clp endopeptidase proteolytic subunit ClpP
MDSNFIGMIKRHSFLWVTDFDVKASEEFYKNFMEMESDPTVQMIPVYINSYGGNVYSLTSIRDLIKSSSKPVATICVGMAMSAGAWLLCAGTKGARFASPNSRIMIHEVSSASWGKNSDLQNDAKLTKELNDMLFANIAEDCGISISKLKSMIKDNNNADLYLTAQQAKKIGMIDEIVIPRTYHQHESTHIAVIPYLGSETTVKSRMRKK